MKKIFLYMAVIAIGFTSCDKKEAFENEKSNLVAAAGEWYVQYDHSQLGADPFGEGHVELLTFNSSADDSLWVSDDAFWGYKLKVDVNIDNLTFQGGEPASIEVVNGIMVNSVVVMPSGAVTDSISYDVVIGGFADWVNTNYGTSITSDTMNVHGYRHTGFAEDAAH